MTYIKAFFSWLFQISFSAAVLALSINVFAEELSNVDAKALEQTVQMLNNKSQRQAAVNQNDESKKADAMAKNLFGEKGVDKAYAAAAEILKTMVKQTNGDSAEMSKMMQEAQANPAEYLKKLSAEHQQMIKKLAEDVERTRAPANNNR